MILYVIDQDPNSLVKQLQDTSRVPKFTISEEKYSQRENNIKKIKENMLKQKLQKEDTFPDHIKIGKMFYTPSYRSLYNHLKFLNKKVIAVKLIQIIQNEEEL